MSPGAWRRVTTLARHEARIHFRSPLLWGLVLFAAFATLMINPAAMIPSGDQAIGGVRPFSNSHFALAQVFALSGLLFYTFLVSILAGMSIPHDDEAKIGDLLHSTPLSPAEYLAGKFIGVLSALGSVAGIHLLLAMGWYEGAGFLGTDLIRGPFQLSAYLTALLLFLGPGLFFCAAMAFATGEITRSPMAVYGVPTVTFLFTLGGLIPRPASALDVVLDPFLSLFDLWGARWLSQTVFTEDRGAAYYNSAPFPFDATFFLSRAVAIGLPLVALALAWRHCTQVVRGLGSSRAGNKTPAAPQNAPLKAPAKPLRELHMNSSPPGALRGALAITRAELTQIRSQPALYLFGSLVLLLGWESASSARGVFDSVPIQSAGTLAIGQIEVVTMLGALLLLFHLVESLDRARRLGFGALLYTSPLPTSAILIGTQLAGGVLVAGMLLGATGVGLLYLALQPVGVIEIWPFLIVFFVVLAPTFLFWSALVAALYSFLRDRYLTYVVAIFFLMGMVALLLVGELTWISNWPLWGALRWTDLGAFELNGAPLRLNRALVLAAALFCQVLALGLFPRQEREGRRLPRATVLRLAAAFLPAGVLALFLAVGIEKGFQGDARQAEETRYWRRNVATWAHRPPPVLRSMDVQVALEPEQRSLRVEGFYTVGNDSAEPMDRLPFTVGADFKELVFTLEGNSAASENRSGLHVVSLPHPLPPGGEVRIGFRYHAVLLAGFTRNGGGSSEFLLPSGAMLSTLGPDFLPLPGFLEGRGVEASWQPEPAEAGPELWRQELPPIFGPPRPFDLRLEVNVPAEYQVSAVGARISEEIAGGRRTVVWQSDHPLRFVCLTAGRWAERREGDNSVYYHPDHAYNVDEMLAALVAARRHYSEFFVPYPWRELRLSEYADHDTRAQGFPTHIPFSEGIGFLTRGEPGQVGLPTLVTAHEVAHQWWGHLLTPGRGPGADVLIESMANYSTLLFLEAEHGPAARQDYARHLEANYAENRRVDSETPLLRVTGEGPADETLIYDKGAWVLWMLHQHLGEKQMLAGLGDFLRSFEGSRDHPLLGDLFAALRPRAASPAAFDAFVEQWFERVVLPEFVLRDVQVEKRGDAYRLTAIAENVGTGEAKVEVAAFRGERFTADHQEVRAAIHLAPGQPAAIELVVPFAPDGLEVDPDLHQLQLHRDRARVLLPGNEGGGDSR